MRRRQSQAAARTAARKRPRAAPLAGTASRGRSGRLEGEADKAARRRAPQRQPMDERAAVAGRRCDHGGGHRRASERHRRRALQRVRMSRSIASRSRAGQLGETETDAAAKCRDRLRAGVRRLLPTRECVRTGSRWRDIPAWHARHARYEEPSADRSRSPTKAATSSSTSTSNPVKQVADEPVSTFSADVDTASYSFVRRQLNAGVPAAEGRGARRGDDQLLRLRLAGGGVARRRRSSPRW